jgi:release factor glutamine methyltransferase
MRNFIKKITHPFFKFGLNLYYSKPREYCYEEICVKVHPNVFPPHLTFSTKILLDFIKPIDLKGKTFLELGCGSGIISLLASKKGAVVFSSDINQTALNYLDTNAVKNNLLVTTFFSDLFESIPNSTFDYIIINPPYYPKKPKNIKENAWFCGEHFEYFEKLFYQLQNIECNNIFMILSQDCAIENIKSISNKNNFSLSDIQTIKNKFETNYIFKIIMK